MPKHLLTFVLLLVIVLQGTAEASFRLEYADGVEPRKGIRAMRVTATADEVSYAGREARVRVAIAPPRIYHGRCYWEPGLPPLSVMRRENTTGDPTAKNPKSSASGCHQIVNGTWDGFMGYPTARSAPVWVQNAKAKQLMRDDMGICHWAETSDAC